MHDKKGYFLGPTLIDSVKPNMESYLNEIFGPVLQIIEIDDVEEGIQIINENSFGNGCCIFTENGNNAREFSEKVDIGMVGVNAPKPVRINFSAASSAAVTGDLSIFWRIFKPLSRIFKISLPAKPARAIISLSNLSRLSMIILV